MQSAKQINQTNQSATPIAMAVAESWSPFTGFGRSVARRQDFQPQPRVTERPRRRRRWAVAAVIACPRCYRKVWMAADRQREEMPYLQPGSSWNSFRILSQAPERSRLEDCLPSRRYLRHVFFSVFAIGI
eukprot:symbB.v1.2.028177.t1/scaffold2915.1/size67295/2